jgi:pimeloyl-ACP methyl ester carboxylesterase
MTDPTTQAGDSGYAPVNGLEMYYEVHGSGRPLLLLHGNLSTIGVDFGGIIPSLAKQRQVIGVEQQAHGHTADIDRPLSIQNWTADTVALLRHLGSARPTCSATAPGRRWPCSSPSTTPSGSASWCWPRSATGSTASTPG